MLILTSLLKIDNFEPVYFIGEIWKYFRKYYAEKFEVGHKYLLLCAQAYVHARRTPLFRMVHSKQVTDITGIFKCGKWQYKWWFFVYFWKIKGMNLQNNGVWRMVHHKLMYEPAPSGINNRSCTQSHSWTPKFTSQNNLKFSLSVCANILVTVL